MLRGTHAVRHPLILNPSIHSILAVPNTASPDPSVDDPRPTPPIQPELEDCCNSGCSPCVFDLYDEALARYRVELAEWEARQAQRQHHA
ncbi:oxidoreductase [Burkholderia contaminans]|nr:oxidoreductase [Burkholderia contaminans]VWD44718.1 oxidoreductase [Burkholderia contaminans]VWD44895.1 oxidoreductase [Burkholderia contaminans]